MHLVDALYKIDNENIIKQLGVSIDGMTLIDADRRKKIVEQLKKCAF